MKDSPSESIKHLEPLWLAICLWVIDLPPHPTRLGNVYLIARCIIWWVHYGSLIFKASLPQNTPLVLNVGSSHHIWHIWSTVRDNIHDSRRAQIKCKILTGTYILQVNRAAFNQYTVDSTWKLCCRDPETPLHVTRQHFVFCGGVWFLWDRKKSLHRENVKEPNLVGSAYSTTFSHSYHWMCNDSSIQLLWWGVGVIWTIYTREYLYRLHVRRVVALRKL